MELSYTLHCGGPEPVVGYRVLAVRSPWTAT
jgi:hypothetical protein